MENGSEHEKMDDLFEIIYLIKNKERFLEQNYNRRLIRNFMNYIDKNHNYIIQPIQVEQIEEIEDLSKLILANPKLRVCIGSPKNGKTALIYKLLLGLIKQEASNSIPLFIGLDRVSIYDYWNNRIFNSTIDQIVINGFKQIPFIYAFSLISNNNSIISVQSIIEDANTKINYNLIFFDGFDWCFEIMNTDEINEFVKYLYSLVKNKGISVYLNSQEYYSCFDETKMNDQCEKWKLERPEYLGGDIIEWGDTRLTIEMD